MSDFKKNKHIDEKCHLPWKPVAHYVSFSWKRCLERERRCLLWNKLFYHVTGHIVYMCIYLAFTVRSQQSSLPTAKAMSFNFLFCFVVEDSVVLCGLEWNRSRLAWTILKHPFPRSRQITLNPSPVEQIAWTTDFDVCWRIDQAFEVCRSV